MQTLEPLILISGAMIVAAISSVITAAYFRQRIHRVSQDSWRAARIFYRANPPT